MLVRRERPGDVRAIRRVHTAAFPTVDRGPVFEAELVDDLRASSAWIPALSLVAAVGEAVVGHVVCSRARVGDATPVLGLGPLGVLPDQQGRGVGTALMHAVLAAADALDEPLVGLLGEPGYYARFGFVTAGRVGIRGQHRGWGDAFQVRLLTCYEPSVTGRFAYAPAFRVD